MHRMIFIRWSHWNYHMILNSQIQEKVNHWTSALRISRLTKWGLMHISFPLDTWTYTENFPSCPCLQGKKKSKKKDFVTSIMKMRGDWHFPNFGFTVIPHQLRNIFVTISSVYFKKGRRGQSTNYFLAPLLAKIQS